MQDVALFPPEARCVFYLTDDATDTVDLTRYEDLHPDERNEVSTAVDVRKGERFFHGEVAGAERVVVEGEQRADGHPAEDRIAVLRGDHPD